MAAEGIKYTRLPGRMRGILHGASLWMGDDHLLAVSGWRFTEDYKRYYYRDIQAIVVTREPRFVFSALWVLAVAAAGLTASFAMGLSAPRLAEGCAEALVVLGLYLLIVSLAQSCRCRIQTAVSREELPSLYRMWTARKALAIIERRVGEVQGVLVEGWMASLTAVPQPASEATPTSGVSAKADGLRGRASATEVALYASLVLGGSALLYRPQGVLWTVVLVAQILLGVGVLVQGHLRGGARSANVLAILVMVLGGAVAYTDNLVSALHHAQAHPRQFTLKVQPEDLGQTPLLNQVYAGGCLVLAASGVLAVAFRRKE